MNTLISVTLEVTTKRSFASAADWPGWARPGRTPEKALEALAAYADRYAEVVAEAGLSLTTDDLAFVVEETGDGNATTEFGAPGRVTDLDRRPSNAAEGLHLASLLRAAWAFLDATAAGAPERLRKGPRGGGRDTSKIVAHVGDAELAYARELGIRAQDAHQPAPGSQPGRPSVRQAVLDVLGAPSDGSPVAGRRWTTRYATHRIAWHVLDHAWEIEDRADSATAISDDV